MNNDEQRKVLSRILSYSDTHMLSDFEDACDTLIEPVNCDFDHIDYVLNLDMSDDGRSQLCEKYFETLDGLKDTQDMNTWELYVVLTGNDSLYLPAAVPVIPAGSKCTSYGYYLNAETYADEHYVKLNDIFIPR